LRAISERCRKSKYGQLLFVHFTVRQLKQYRVTQWNKLHNCFEQRLNTIGRLLYLIQRLGFLFNPSFERGFFCFPVPYWEINNRTT
jgi:hypothetical protein